ncbi:hypothetical protein Bca4012_064755 [Brassica carinata]
MLDGQTFTVQEEGDPLEPHEGMIEEILTDDPLELALVRAEAEQSLESIDADAYAKVLDSARSMEKIVANLSLGEDSELSKPAGTTAPLNPSVPAAQADDSWSELKAPKVELKSLPKGLRYAFLGFFQIPIHPDDQEKTTFTCPYGTYAYRRMPFGLCNAPATFQRCMMSIFTDLIEDIMEVFMDDFSVYGSSFHVCLSNLDGIVLGHKISEKGIEVDKAKIEVMMSLQPPTSVKGIRSFLGQAGFYRRFIQDFSKIARPLTRLLCKEAQFAFDSDCLAAFHTIKGALVSAPIVQPRTGIFLLRS